MQEPRTKRGRPCKEESVEMEKALFGKCFNCSRKDCVYGTTQEAYWCCVLGKQRPRDIRRKARKKAT